MSIHEPIHQQNLPSIEPEIIRLWGQLSPSHEQLVVEIMRACARLDGAAEASQSEKNQGSVSLMLLARQLEYEAMSPEEREQAEQEWEEFKATMNANRAPELPLFL